MANAYDVARYICERRGPLSAMKLQKLVYYSQAWSLVWDDAALFSNKIEAWANGPVVRTLYDAHNGKFVVDADTFPAGRSENLSQDQMETIDAVLEAYGDRTAQWLSDQTHSEYPWIQARRGLGERDRGNAEISHASMAEYYGSIPA